MKTRHYFISLAASLGTLALIGCTREADTTTTAEEASEDLSETAQAAGDSMEESARQTGEAMESATASAKQALDETTQELSESWDNVRDATYDERASFQTSVEDLANRVDQELDEIDASDPTISQTALANLRQARETLGQELNELGDATAANWEQAKQDVADAWEQVRAALENLRS